MIENHKKQDLTSSPSPPPLSPPPNKPSRLLTKILKRTIGGLFVLLAVLVLLASGTDVLDNLFGLPEGIDTTQEGPFMESKDIVFFEPAGEINIPGDIITHKQLVSLVPEGTPPLNVVSKTTVPNLSAEFWNDLSLDDLTLELILENGQTVQKKVIFGGGIETTEIDTSSANIFGPLVVYGPTALQNVTTNNIASNDIDARNLSVSENTILNNLSVNQDLAVSGISSLATTNISGPLTVTAPANFQDIEAESLTTDFLTINTAQIREVLNIGADNEAGILVKTDDSEIAGQPQIIYNPAKGVWMLRNSNGFFSEITTESTDSSGRVLAESEVEAFIFDTDNVAGATKIAANADGIDMLTLQRFTDVSPTGNFINLQNTAGNSLLIIDALGRFSTDILPATTSTRNLGSDALRWANVFVDTMNAGTIDAGTIATDFTQGSVMFAGANGNLAEDNSNFFFNNTDKRLGLRTAIPTAALSFAESTIAEGGIAFAEDTNLYRNAANTLKTDDALFVQGALTASSTLSVTGVATLESTLDVSGDANFDANIIVGDESTDTVTVNSNTWTFANDTNFVLSGGVNGFSFDTDTLSVDAISDRIGVGTSSPDATLDVVGDIQSSQNITINSASSAFFVADREATTDFNGLQLATAGTTRWTVGSRNDSTEDLHIFDDSSALTRLFIEQSTGNVGIGTASPGTLLHLGSDSDGVNIITLGSPSGSSGPHGIDLLNDDGSVGASLYYRTGPQTLNVEGSDLNMNSNTLLDVGRIEFTSGEVIDDGTDLLFTSNSGFMDFRPSDGTHGFINRDFTGGSTVWSAWRTNSTGDAEFTADSNYNQFVLKANGRVGIGTMLPTNAFHVVGTAYISGNLGVGVGSPSHKVDVSGNVAANGFVNKSSLEFKRDIRYLDDDEQNTSNSLSYEGILEQVKNTRIAQYHYNFEGDSEPLRLGLIAEEAPSEVLSVDGKGIDLYKLSSFTLAGLKAQQKQFESMQARLAELEIKTDISHAVGVAEPYTSNFSSKLITSLKDLFRVAEIHLRDGIVAFKELSIDKIITRELTLEEAGSGLDGPDPTVGTSTLKKDEREKTIQNISVKENSMIFISVRGETPIAWSIGEINPGVSFTVRFERPAHEELLFQWWIVQVK